MSAVPDDELVRELYRTDPDEFVAHRDTTVRRLKADGRKEEAALLAKLRRPKVAEHALNLLAGGQPELVDRWASAVAVAEQQQAAAIGGGDAGALADALKEVRALSVEVIDAAVAALGQSGPAQRTAIADTLRTATSTVGTARVRAGLMGSPFEPSVEFFPGTEHVAVRPPAARPTKPERLAAMTAAPVRRVGSKDTDRRAAEQAARAAAEEARRREAEAAAHRKELEKASARLARAAARHTKALHELESATAELREAEQAMAALERSRDI